MENTIYDIKRRIDKVKLQLANKSNNVESDQSIEQKRKTSEQFQKSTVFDLKDDASPNQRANERCRLQQQDQLLSQDHKTIQVLQVCLLHDVHSVAILPSMHVC